MNDLTEIGRRLRATLMRRGAAPHDADDIVQEAFLRFEEAGARATVLHPKAFIARIASNLAIDLHRRRKRSAIAAQPIENYEVPDFNPGPLEILNARQRLKHLHAGLAKLSPRSVRILLAQRLQGLSHAEIAEQEGISLSGVEKQISRSLQFLTEWMNSEP